MQWLICRVVKQTAEFGIDEDELYLKSRNEAEHKKAIAVVKEMVAVETMKTEGAKADVLKSAAFKRFQQETRKNNDYGIYLKVICNVQCTSMYWNIKLSTSI